MIFRVIENFEILYIYDFINIFLFFRGKKGVLIFWGIYEVVVVFLIMWGIWLFIISIGDLILFKKGKRKYFKFI